MSKTLTKISKDILAYNKKQSRVSKEICEVLAEGLSRNLPKAENKIWHAHPVWFLDGNPIVGYDKLKDCVRLFLEWTVFQGKRFTQRR